MSDEIFDEDLGRFRKRTLTNGQVFGFIAGFWRRRPVAFGAAVTLTLISIGFEMAVPHAAQGLVDAMAGARA